MRDSTFTEFVGVSLPALSRYAYALTGNVHAGEDLVLVQDTLVKLAGRWRHVTRDNGATWQSRPLPLTTGPNWVSTVDGKLVYAGSGTHLVRSTDGGATWAEIPGISGLPDPDNYGLALPDGSLLMMSPSQEGGLYRLANGSTTVESLTGAPAHPLSLYRTGGMVVAAQAWAQSGDPDLGPVAWVSPDSGTTWLPIPSPAP